MKNFTIKRSYANVMIAAGLALGLSGCCGHHNDYSRTTGECDLGTLEKEEVATIVLGYYPGKVEEETGEKATLTFSASGSSVNLRQAAQAAVASKNSGRPACGRHDLESRERAILDAYRQNCLAKGTDLNAKEVNTTYTDLAEGETTTVSCLNSYKTGIVVQKMHANADTTSVIVLAEQDSKGDPVITKEDALEIDKYFGTKNDYDPDGMAIGDRVRKTFGSEWRQDGGIDGTEKLVVIVFANDTIGSGTYGFMTYVDCLPSTEKTYSNMGEIVYLNGSKKGVDRYSTLAHEFQHLCNYNQKTVHDGDIDLTTYESTNVTEGLSVLAEDEAGFGLEIEQSGTEKPGNYFIGNAINHYCVEPESFSSVKWGNSLGDYGKAYLTMRYIADSFGLTCINDIATSEGVGMENIEYCTGEDYNSIGEGMTVASLGISSLPEGFRFDKLVLNKIYSLQATAESDPEDVYVSSVRGEEYTASEASGVVVKPELNANTSVVIDVTGEGENFKFKYDLPSGYTLNTVVSKNDVYEDMKKVK